MKARMLLQSMNIIDKAVLLLLLLSLVVGISATSLHHLERAEIHTATVLFPAADASFGSDALPGDALFNSSGENIGAVYEITPTDTGVRLTLTCDSTFPYAVGETVFFRSKQFAGTGKIKSLNLGDNP